MSIWQKAKGTMAGFVPGIIYNLIKGKKAALSNKRNFFGSLLAAISAPIVNTGIFVCGMLIFFMDTLTVWANGSDIASYIILGLAGLNFLVEFLINIILTPTIIRIVDVVKKN